MLHQPALISAGAGADPHRRIDDLSPLEEQITSISQEIAATLELSQAANADDAPPGDPGADARASERDGSEGGAGARHGGSASPRADVAGAPAAAARPAIPLAGGRGGAASKRDADIDRLLAEALGEDDEDFFPVPLRARKPASAKRKR